jgi:hypothetical protein
MLLNSLRVNQRIFNKMKKHICLSCLHHQDYRVIIIIQERTLQVHLLITILQTTLWGQNLQELNIGWTNQLIIILKVEILLNLIKCKELECLETHLKEFLIPNSKIILMEDLIKNLISHTGLRLMLRPYRQKQDP